MPKSQDPWDKFVDTLLETVGKALDTGEKARLRIGGTHDITIDIYPTGTTMKVFDEAILSVAKQHRGMSIAGKDKPNEPT
jgi:hypothetical protein